MRKKRFGRGLALCLAALTAFTAAGCFGKFQLTRKVYEFNESVENKYLRSATTWLFAIIPVYGASALLDLVFFNVVEFWNGENPISSAPATKVFAAGGERAVMTISRRGAGTVAVIRTYRGDVAGSTIVVRDAGDGTVSASRLEGVTVVAESRARTLPDGSLSVTATTPSGTRAARYAGEELDAFGRRALDAGGRGR